MAGDSDVSSVLSEKSREFTCGHCCKKVVNCARCAKCDLVFHPKCLLQAAAAKSAVCRHEVAAETDCGKATKGGYSVDLDEKSLLLRIISELEEKNALLQENNSLLREKVRFMELSRHQGERGLASLSTSASVMKFGSQTVGQTSNLADTNAARFPGKQKSSQDFSINVGSVKSLDDRTNDGTSSVVLTQRSQIPKNGCGSTNNAGGSKDLSCQCQMPASSDDIRQRQQDALTNVNENNSCGYESGTDAVTDAGTGVMLGKVKYIEPKRAFAAIHEEVTRAKTREIIDLGSTDKPGNETEWKLVKERRKNRQISKRNRDEGGVLGTSLQPTKLKAVPKTASLHVTRLSTETRDVDVKELLADRFPEVGVEEMQSRFPEVYKSFKVTVNQDNYKMAMLPEIWPVGVRVSRFFHWRAQKKTLA